MNQQQRKTITIITLVTILFMATMPVLVEAKHSPKKQDQNQNGYIVKQQLGHKVTRYHEYIPLDPSGLYYSVNVYAIETKNTVVLIDAGHELLAEQLYDEVASDFTKKEIVVLLTHGHADHAGGGSYLQNKGATIFVHGGDWETVYNGYENDQAPPEFRYPGYIAFPLEMGETPITFMGLKIIWTPGHTPGSISVYDPKSDGLFTGDLFITLGEAESELDYTSYIVLMTLQSHSFTPLLEMQYNSIDGLDTNVKTLYTGHYGPYKGENIVTVVQATLYAISQLPWE